MRGFFIVILYVFFLLVFFRQSANVYLNMCGVKRMPLASRTTSGNGSLQRLGLWGKCMTNGEYWSDAIVANGGFYYGENSLVRGSPFFYELLNALYRGKNSLYK